jgi:hypothetical protein
LLHEHRSFTLPASAELCSCLSLPLPFSIPKYSSNPHICHYKTISNKAGMNYTI